MLAVKTISQSIFRNIGQTPLIPLANVGSGALKLYAKLEWYNPFGSLKDRPAYWMIQAAERQGLLRRGESIVIEPTSGNTGVALAGICSALGYQLEVIVPKRVSQETKAILRALGAKMLEADDDLCPRVGAGTDQAIALANAIVKGRPGKYFMPNQYENEANFRAHYETTGPEIWRETDGKITHFITGMGTGGTITGVSTYLKEQNPSVKVVGVQPQKNHHLQGLRNLDESLMPDLLKRRVSVVDEKVTISDAEAFSAISLAARKENLFLGPSSGATFSAALSLVDRVRASEGGVAVVIFGDSGHKYWSIFDEFGVFTKDEFEQLRSGARFVSKPLFLDAVSNE